MCVCKALHCLPRFRLHNSGYFGQPRGPPNRAKFTLRSGQAVDTRRAFWYAGFKRVAEATVAYAAEAMQPPVST